MQSKNYVTFISFDISNLGYPVHRLSFSKLSFFSAPPWNTSYLHADLGFDTCQPRWPFILFSLSGFSISCRAGVFGRLTLVQGPTLVLGPAPFWKHTAPPPPPPFQTVLLSLGAILTRPIPLLVSLSKMWADNSFQNTPPLQACFSTLLVIKCPLRRLFTLYGSSKTVRCYFDHNLPP